MIQPTSGEIVIKTVVTHTVTYFILGFLAFVGFDYRHLYDLIYSTLNWASLPRRN